MESYKHLSEGDINHSSLREKWSENQMIRVADELLKRDADVFLHQALSTPCLDNLVHAEGIYLIDSAGKKYMDFHGNNVHQLGYGHSALVGALKDQVEELAFCPRRFTNEKAINYAEALVATMPMELTRVLFAPGGTSAVSMAIKLARLVTGKFKMVALWDAFHGAGLDAISVGGEAQFREGMGPLMPGVERIAPPNRYRNIWNTGDNDVPYADYLEYVIEKEGGIGAFIAETVRNTDVQIPSKAYWKRIREICDKHGILLILDEIPIAFGRTGKMFAFEHFGIVPDIVCLGKGMGGGLIPMAGIVTREKFNAMAGQISLGHYTFEKNPMGAAVGLAVLETIQNQNLLLKVQSDEIWMRQQLNQLQHQYKEIGDIRGLGLLWGIELVKDRQTKEKHYILAEKVMYGCLEKGLSFKVSQGNVLQLSPPLIIDRQQLIEAMNILIEVLDESISTLNN
ncbi:aspartate aminotransferase family protein [Rhizosphaericola mali]|uniref:Aspartate aminotransferase family protein n=1 Tax=Rhizosphaericola mali TaxID=2545455 RepID=A0A5P2G2U9_9BACT|nr:aspartate aminotransferase family protein [Rhizosphaericola mali]QES89815.1 aspartate aminotransferase family protein [Rhizosphaericola mali]